MYENIINKFLKLCSIKLVFGFESGESLYVCDKQLILIYYHSKTSLSKHQLSIKPNTVHKFILGRRELLNKTLNFMTIHEKTNAFED